MAQSSAISLGLFDLYEPLARGGAGEVWHGLHLEQQIPVAVKVITTEQAREPLHRQAFEREVEAIAGLDHPGIVMVLDYGAIPAEAEAASGGRLIAGSPYLVMELAAGGLDGSPMSWEPLRALLLAILDALAHAHARGVIHRDLKPANVLRFPGEEHPVKLADFGIAWVADQREGSSIPSAGTPRYMAPEQITGKWLEFGPWTDLYGLGCMAWRLATGKHAFAAPMIDMLRAKFEGPGAFRSSMELPLGFEGWLRALLVPDPRLRAQRAADAAWELSQLVSPPPSSARGRSAPLPSSDETLVDTLALPTPMRAVASESASPAPSAGLAPMKPPPLPPATWRTPHVRRSMKLFGAGLALYGLRRPAMVGRIAERDTLWSALHRVATAGRPEAVLLRGAAGTGKTRLAQWLCERAHELGAATALEAVHGEQGSPVDGLAPMVARHLRCTGLSRTQVDARVENALAPVGLAQVAALTELILPLARGEDPQGVPVVQLPTVADRVRVVCNLVGNLCRERPVIVWLDDVQWGQDALELAHSLLEGSPAPVLLLMTVRQEALETRASAAAKLSALASRPDTTDLTLAPLEKAERVELVRDLLGLEGTLADQVEARTAGMPLFAVQLVEDWVQRGHLELGPEGFRLRAGVAAEIPDALHGLWVWRVEHLLQERPETDRQALELAAVLGHNVDPDEWRAVCEQLNIDLPDGLVDLMVTRALASRTEGAGWAFVHGMLGESLVRQAREAGRLQTHRAACSETLYALGEDARKAGRAPRGEGLLRRAVALATDEARLARMRSALALALFAQGRYRDAQPQLELVLAGCRTLGLRSREGNALGHLGILHMQQGRVDEALAHYEQALAIHRELGDRDLEGTVLGNLAVLHVGQGRLDQGREHLEAALALQREVDDRQSVAKSITNLGIIALEQGRADAALTHYLEALAMNREIGNRASEGNVLGAIGTLHRVQGRSDDARAHYEEALEVHREVGNRRAEGFTLGDLADLQLLLGDSKAALDMAAQALAILRDVGLEYVSGKFHGTQALAHAHLGDFAAARRCLDHGERILRDVGYSIELGRFLCRRGHVELLSGNEAGAREALRGAVLVGEELAVASESELGKALAGLRTALEGE